jgi:hypothetical protein
VRTVDLISFLLPAAIQMAVVVVLVRRNLKNQFPFFFSYTAYSVLVTFLRLVAVHNSVQYVFVYWSTEVLYGILAILALNEVFQHIFELDYRDHPSIRFVLPSIVLLLIAGLFIWWSFVHPGRAHIGPASAGLRAFDLAVHSVEVIVLLLFLGLRWAFIAAWSRHDYGILLGFGVSALVTMGADAAARLGIVANYEAWFRNLPGLGYILATLIWLHAFWAAHDPIPRPLIRFRAMLEQVRQDSRLLRLIHAWLHRPR